MAVMLSAATAVQLFAKQKQVVEITFVVHLCGVKIPVLAKMTVLAPAEDVLTPLCAAPPAVAATTVVIPTNQALILASGAVAVHGPALALMDNASAVRQWLIAQLIVRYAAMA